jgi:hypothetical protein
MKALPWIAGGLVAAVTLGVAAVALGLSVGNNHPGNMQDHMGGSGATMSMPGMMGMSGGDMAGQMAQHMGGAGMPAHDQHHPTGP